MPNGKENLELQRQLKVLVNFTTEHVLLKDKRNKSPLLLQPEMIQSLLSKLSTINSIPSGEITPGKGLQMKVNRVVQTQGIRPWCILALKLSHLEHSRTVSNEEVVGSVAAQHILLRIVTRSLGQKHLAELQYLDLCLEQHNLLLRLYQPTSMNLRTPNCRRY